MCYGNAGETLCVTGTRGKNNRSLCVTGTLEKNNKSYVLRERWGRMIKVYLFRELKKTTQNCLLITSYNSTHNTQNKIHI